MNVDVSALHDAPTPGGGETPPCAGLTSNALPETQSLKQSESSPIGVSTRYVQMSKDQAKVQEPHWYVLRCTYGREKKAYDYMTANGITAYYPTQNTLKIINGKRKVVSESLLPNLFFAYGTESQIKTFVYDNVNLPFLRFYYRHTHTGSKIEKTPLIVPKAQMESLKIVCSSEVDDIIVTSSEITKFKEGQKVRVVKGKFTGFVGKVARYKGQQRVGIVVANSLTVITAYVPNAYCERVEEG